MTEGGYTATSELIETCSTLDAGFIAAAFAWMSVRMKRSISHENNNIMEIIAVNNLRKCLFL